MDEKIIIKGQRKNPIGVLIGFIVAGALVFLTYFMISINSYRDYYRPGYTNPVNGKRVSAKRETLSFAEGLKSSIECDGGLIPILLVAIAIGVVGFIIYKNWNKIEIIVTDKRVYGVNAKGKRVDLPLDAISAIGLISFSGVVVTTASGAIRFRMLENKEAIHGEISKLLIERQSKGTVVGTSKDDVEDLAKFKKLLDEGVITQEEFDAKKKQILSL